jgi:hypothetical protein
MMSTDGTSRGFSLSSPWVSGVGPFLKIIAEDSNFCHVSRGLPLPLRSAPTRSAADLAN